MLGLAGNQSTRGVATSTQKNKNKNHNTIHNMPFTQEELSLPPIIRPLLYEDVKNQGR